MVFGTDKKCSVKEYDKILFPDDKKEELIKTIKEKGLYEDFSSLNYFKLSPKVLKKEVDERINKAIALAPYNGVPIKSDRIQKLFIVAKGDNVTSSISIKKLYNDSSEPKKMVEFEGSAHAQHLFKGSHKEKLSDLIIDFITE